VVRLPLGAMAAVQKDDASAPRDAVATRRRVLVVDDNVDAAASLRAALELAGHAVETAHDGAVSLSVIETFNPEIVLLDIGLPRMDGYQLARRIRSMPGGDKRLLAAVTGWGQEGDRDRAREAGFDRHMTKPITLQALDALLAAAPAAERR